MFEFNNKDNKVKIINVTEARGNFAMILSDSASQYVITKNNKPQRVIINFEDFQKLQGIEEAANMLAQVASSSAVQADESQTARGKKSKVEHPLKGVLATQFELANQATSPQEDQGQSGAFSLDDVKAFEPLEKATELGGEGDYFQDESGEVSDLDKIVVATPTSPLVNEDVASMAPPAEANLPEPASEDTDAVARTPEEEEYFRRYRKLYENHTSAFEGTNTATSTTPEIEIRLPEPKPRQEFFTPPPEEEPLDFHQIVEEHFNSDTAPVVMETVLKDPSIGDFKKWNESFVSTNSSIQVGISNNPEATATSPVESLESPAEHVAKTNEELPSLQELLRDLDQEHLPGEDHDPLDTREIDDIINRITSD